MVKTKSSLINSQVEPHSGLNRKQAEVVPLGTENVVGSTSWATIFAPLIAQENQAPF